MKIYQTNIFFAKILETSYTSYKLTKTIHDICDNKFYAYAEDIMKLLENMNYHE